MSDSPSELVPPVPPAPDAPDSRRKLVALAVLLALAGVGAYFALRPPAPVPPPIDLARVDPEVADAVRAALSGTSARPRDAAAWGKLGMVLRAHDFDRDCLAAFRTAAELDPKDYRWPYLDGLTRVLHDPDAGLERLLRAAELAPANRPDPRLRAAEALLERGELDRAAELAEGVMKVKSNPRATLVLGRVAAARGDWAAALARADELAPVGECARAAYLLRGEALAGRGLRAEADGAYARAAELPELGWSDPDVDDVRALAVGSNARVDRARDLIRRGRAAEAVPLLRGAGRSPDVTVLLAQVLLRGGQPDAARAELTALVAAHPDSVEVWFNLGLARAVLEEYAPAADAFARVTALKPDHTLGHFNLGVCKKKLGDRPGARAEFAAALTCNPGHKPSRDALAELDAGK